MKTIDESNLMEHPTGLIVQFQDENINRDSFARMTFRLDIFCSIPILVFEFADPSQILFLPVRFWQNSELNNTEPWTITIQIQGHDCHLRHERMFGLTPIQLAKIQLCKKEQEALNPGQLDAIEDYIYSDFIGMLN
ncbi:hypothetical protein [Dyadobacter psychrotolerans]|uniref:Uncharacterized protein n=1 Tax=Dyadobacter psychrotolerans TaxID=2541721 RepID=A0A4R5DG70_9BACT|nr:hypothetical protein [Dyadobacter psychrotolerans]TDE10804.1 hypothetical protein E0F88_27410 [Dyadobacter psychrotolerans]